MIKSFRADLVATTLAAAVTAAGSGCQHKDKSQAPADHHGTPEGRLQVDQSAVLPVNVKAAVQKEYPGSAVQSVNKRTYDDRIVRYEVTLQTKEGRQVTRVFDSEGKPMAGQ
jgi:hypothetical protein